MITGASMYLAPLYTAASYYSSTAVRTSSIRKQSHQSSARTAFLFVDFHMYSSRLTPIAVQLILIVVSVWSVFADSAAINGK